MGVINVLWRGSYIAPLPLHTEHSLTHTYTEKRTHKAHTHITYTIKRASIQTSTHIYT